MVRPATAPMTPARLRALAGFAAVCLLAFGVIAGQISRRAALFSLRDVRWGTGAVTVTYRDGDALLPLVILVLVLAAIGWCCWWGGRFAARRSFADIEGTRRWMLVAAALGALAVAGAVGGWFTTTTSDGVEAARVASFLEDEGGPVDVQVIAGERIDRRPTGAGRRVLVAPVTLQYTADGSVCTVTVDDPVTGDGETFTFAPTTCRPLAVSP